MLKRLESKRTSVLTDDLDHCIVCKQHCDDINEIFLGRNRISSIKYGLCIPMCRKCHNRYHIDRQIQLYWMNIGIKKFLEEHSIEEFRQNFYYVKGLEIY